jgi:hypothetical protein
MPKAIKKGMWVKRTLMPCKDEYGHTEPFE